MDHIWSSLKRWEDIWLERIEDEKKKPDYEGKYQYIRSLEKDVAAIQRAMKEIHTRF